jgi:hypothetical protein
MTWSFGSQGLEVTESDTGPVDCRLSMTPSTFLLVGYGRVPPLRAALTGRALAWGRRPFAAFRFTDYFTA